MLSPNKIQPLEVRNNFFTENDIVKSVYLTESNSHIFKLGED